MVDQCISFLAGNRYIFVWAERSLSHFYIEGWMKAFGLQSVRMAKHIHKMKNGYSINYFILVLAHSCMSMSLFSFQCPVLEACYHCRVVTVTIVYKLHPHRLKLWPQHHDLRPQPNPLLSNRLPSNPHSHPTHNNPPYLHLTLMDRTVTAAINTLRVRLPSIVSSYVCHACTFMVKSFHALVKNMYIMAVFCSNCIYNFRVSMMGLMQHKLLCHKNHSWSLVK